MQSIVLYEDARDKDALKKMMIRRWPGIQPVVMNLKLDELQPSIQSHDPEIIFFIDMNEGEVIQTLWRLSPLLLAKHLIFVNTWLDYKIKGYTLHSPAYFIETLGIKATIPADIPAPFLFPDLYKKKNSPGQVNNKTPLQKVIITDNNGVMFINVNEILYFKSERNYTNILMTNEKKYLSTQQLRYYEDLLVQNTFMRVHRSFLVNLDHISRYNRKDDGGVIVLSDKTTIPVSKQKKEAIIQKLQA